MTRNFFKVATINQAFRPSGFIIISWVQLHLVWVNSSSKSYLYPVN
jgi:hypothetical protein